MLKVHHIGYLIKKINKAEKDFGFKTENCKLLIEAYSSIEDVFILTITKYIIFFCKSTINRLNIYNIYNKVY